MSLENRSFSPGPDEHSVRGQGGEIFRIPTGWAHLPPGDAWATKKVKAAGPTWTVAEKRGRKIFSQGIWAPRAHIEAALAEVAARRATPEHAVQLEGGRQRRARAETVYAATFEEAVLAYLGFDERHADLARSVARAVATHATPVGSGTVARTQRIPVAARAEAALMAWMRHQTSDYDRMKIARVKGERRAVRRAIATQSRELLLPYREGRPVDPRSCSLRSALTGTTDGASSTFSAP